jgi:hypothetical protein
MIRYERGDAVLSLKPLERRLRLYRHSARSALREHERRSQCRSTRPIGEARSVAYAGQGKLSSAGAATVNAAQLKELIKLAKQKNLYFQEGVWTRFFPIAVSIKELLPLVSTWSQYNIQDKIMSGAIGRVRHVHAQLCASLGLGMSGCS